METQSLKVESNMEKPIRSALRAMGFEAFRSGETNLNYNYGGSGYTTIKVVKDPSIENYEAKQKLYADFYKANTSYLSNREMASSFRAKANYYSVRASRSLLISIIFFVIAAVFSPLI